VARKARRPHDDASYRRRRAALMKSATPHTKCIRCGRPGHAHPTHHKTGKVAGWHCDHLDPSNNNAPMALSWSTCNLSHGGKIGNAKRWGRARNGGPPPGWTPGPHYPGHYDLDNLAGVGAPPCAQHTGQLCPSCRAYHGKKG
jgi:hypothetical protein